MAKGELLLEVRAEEIPARMLQPAITQLATRVFEELMARDLGPKEVETGFTPRRLLLILKGLPAKEPDRTEQVVGPPVRVAFKEDGSPTPALIGFARRCGLEPEELERVTTDKGEYLAATQSIVGVETSQLLAELLPKLLREINWPKSMVWGDGYGPWARPIHGIVAVLGGQVVPFELFGVQSGAQTCGHAVLSPKPFTVRGAAEYRRKLAKLGIVVQPDERRRILAQAMSEAAAELGGQPVEDPQLLDKLVAICEIPGLMHGSFDADYLGLPSEVLTASLRDHQSAFSVEAVRDEEDDESGEPPLLPAFLTVMDRSDDPSGRVRVGNEWVVAARLADARFFFHEDRKRSLEERRGDLAHLTFHEKLGTYQDKAERLAELAALLCRSLGWSEEEASAAQAARLLKVDLTSEMVKEFTDLQGVMGGIYGREDGLGEEIWTAIYDQYLPASAEDSIPRGRTGMVTALADRIDTLVGIFGLGLIPTGSRDPFGLRRAAQGVVRIALDGGMPVDLDLLAAKAARLYGDKLTQSGEEILESLRPFLFDRVRHVLGLAGFAYDEIEAALAVGGNNLPDLKARVEALHAVRGHKEFLSLVLSAKRILNILKDSEEYDLDEARLVEPAEKALFAAFADLKGEVEELAAAGDHEGCLRRTAGLASVLDHFFAEVLVMDEDDALRRNRLGLLQAIHRVVGRSARLTEMVVDKAEHRAKFGD